MKIEARVMIDEIPNIITSKLSREFSRDGVVVDVDIYRLEDEDHWTLEVVNDAGTSTLWDDQFATDQAAYDEFQRTVAAEGMMPFHEEATIIPFPKK
jgi:uncharacterized protein